nr:unnamed protein product [Digitaria exilis]
MLPPSVVQFAALCTATAAAPRTQRACRADRLANRLPRWHARLPAGLQLALSPTARSSRGAGSPARGAQPLD